MEDKLFKKGYKKILAIDEVGRGSLAGPFFIGGILLTYNKYQELKQIPIKDSKKLSSSKRKEIFEKIKKLKIKYKIIKFNNKKVDKLGIGNCFLKAVFELNNLFKPNLILIDGREIKKIKDKIKHTKFIIKGDSLLISLGAISIISKVLRDEYMINLNSKINLYNFKHNKGYGTSDHFRSILKYGISSYHRKTFLKNYLNNI
ncbi:MAG: hypothetical protein KatS3mg094_436 [Candidatus Parcubacteria bacterium]|nr:MAG: hypothetical protein KatS3mg094_436 [Candidatus Parcubacteria bacterium]